MENNYFHFTLGPVQDFVAQARRTRDFWAGSFLLSWLAGVAMAEVKRQGGEILLPKPADNYLDWITGVAKDGDAPRQGAIPHRFKSHCAQIPTTFNPKHVENAIKQAWRALAEHIWNEDNLNQIQNSETKTIWDRQHESFWEIYWTLAADEINNAQLTQRKNWRTHYGTGEGGVKCMVMDGWQELSGEPRPGTNVKNFWNSLRNLDNTGIKADLAISEQLCGLAYVKRRFVRHFETFATTLESGLTLKGWKLTPAIPSVSYIAAVHWLENLITNSNISELESIYELAQGVNGNHDEYESRIQCLTELTKDKSKGAIAKKIISLDGNLFFDHVLEHAERYGYPVMEAEKFQKYINNLKQNNEKLNEPLSPFYAVLLMDGDSLGVHMSKVENAVPISNALNKFTGSVPALVEQHNGYLIYAGGDDVLALLPLEDALTCAAAVKALYLKCFEEYPLITTTTTISAAVEFAHIKMPLTKVLRDAHNLLDDVAKEATGRDAIAVRVWKPGGMTLQWAQPWSIALEKSDSNAAVPNNTLAIQELAKVFREEGSEFSSNFFFKIEDRFGLLNPSQNESGQYNKAVLSEQQAISLLAVDFKNSGTNHSLTMENARKKIAPLINQCRHVKRILNQLESEWARSPVLSSDGAHLVRFLAQKGVRS